LEWLHISAGVELTLCPTQHRIEDSWGWCSCVLLKAEQKLRPVQLTWGVVTQCKVVIYFPTRGALPTLAICFVQCFYTLHRNHCHLICMNQFTSAFPIPMACWCGWRVLDFEKVVATNCLAKTPSMATLLAKIANLN
jgi:hypothetical protein